MDVIKWIICICLFISNNIYGQVIKSDQLNNKDRESFSEAKKLIQQGNDKKGNKKLEDIIKSNPFFIEGILRLATNYFNQKDYLKAEVLFKDAIKKAPDFDPEMYYSLAMTLKDQGKLSEAILILDTYAQKNHKNSLKVKKANFIKEELKFRVYAYENPVPFKPVRLGNEINSRNSEYSPSLNLDDSGIIFTRNNGQEDLFFVKKDSTGKFSQAFPIPGLNSHQNEGAHTMSADGRFLVFTACDRRDSYGSCDLYSATLTDGKWSKPVNMGQKVNSVGWDSQPQLSPDGRTLYFSSKRQGSVGNSDIYMTFRNDNNSWVTPINIGTTINTEGNDETPFLHPDSQTLYFRSDGRPGMGGFDIYYSRRDSLTGFWQTPVNIGYPINTENQEGGLVVSLNGEKAYFASDIDPNTYKSTGNLDIFSFILYEKARPQPSTYVRGLIKDIFTGKPIDANVSIIDIVTGEKLFFLRTEKDGQFLTTVSAKKMYACVVEREGYRFFSKNFDLFKNTSFDDPFFLDINLTPQEKMAEAPPIVLQNIFFKTGSSELLPESKTEIIQLYKLLIDNQDIGIKIIGHTDSVGNDEYNQKLSEMRAQEVVKAITTQGIDASRLIAQGVGESMPIDSNESESGRQKNRRTEFLVFRLLK